MKRTMLKTTVAALAAATVSSAMADRTYDQPGTTTFTSAETDDGFVWVGSTSGAYAGENDWQIWTTDGSEGAGLTLPNNNLRIADGNNQTGRLKIESGIYSIQKCDYIYKPYTSASFALGLWGGNGYYWQTGGEVTASDNLVVIGGSGNSTYGVASFLLEGGSFANTSSSGTFVGWGNGNGTFEMTGGTFATAGNFIIIEGPGPASSATVSGGEFTVGGILMVGNGNASGGTGTFTASGDAKVTADSIKVGTNVQPGIFNLAGDAEVETKFFVTGTGSAAGRVSMTGGLLTITEGTDGNGAFPLGLGGSSSGEFVQSGGDIVFSNGSAWGAVGHSGSGTSSYTMTGGTFYMNPWGGNPVLVVGRDGTTVGTLDVSGSAVLTARTIQLGEQSGASGTVNLGTGGTIAARWFTCPAGTGIVNLNGGTLKALETNNNFLPLKDNLTVKVKAGGAVFDTQKYNVILNEPLLCGVEDGKMDGGLVKLGTGQLTLASGNTYNGLTDVREGVLAVSAGHDFTGGLRIGSHGAIAVDMTSAVDAGTIAVNDTLVVFKAPSAPTFEYAKDILEESVFLTGPVFGYTLAYDSTECAVVATVTNVDNIASTRKVHSFIAGTEGNYIDQTASWHDGSSPGTYDAILFCEDSLMFIWRGNNSPCETMALRGAVAEVRTGDQHPNLAREKIVGHGTLKLEHVGLQSQYNKDMTVAKNVNVEFSFDVVGNTDSWVKGDGTGTVYVNGTVFVTNGLMRVYEHAVFNGDIVFGGNGSLYDDAFNSDTAINGNVIVSTGYTADCNTFAAYLGSTGAVVLDGGNMLVAPDSTFTYRSGTIRLDGIAIDGAVGTEVALPNATIEAEPVDVAVACTGYSWSASVVNGVLTVTATGALDASTPNCWIGGASGAWNVRQHWTRGVPSAAYATQIDTDSTITLEANKTAGDIVVNGTVHFKNSAGNPNLYFNSMSGAGRVRLSHIGLIANTAETEIADTLTLEPVITTTDSWMEGQNGKLLVVRAPMVGTGYVIVRNNVRFYGDNSGFEGQFRKDDADMRFMTPESGLPNAWKTDIYGTLWLMFSDGTIQFAGNSTFNAQGNHGIHLPSEPGNVVLEVGVGGGDVTFTKTGDGYRFYTENGGNWSAESAGCATATLRKVGDGAFVNNAYDTYNLDCVGGTTVLSNDSTTVAVTVRDGATLKIAEDRAVGSVAFESGAKFVTTVTETTEDEVTVSSAARLTASGAASLSATEISTEGATPDTSVRYPVISAASISGSAVADIEDPDTTDKMVWLAKTLGSGVSLKYGRANPGFAVVIR